MMVAGGARKFAQRGQLDVGQALQLGAVAVAVVGAVVGAGAVAERSGDATEAAVGKRFLFVDATFEDFRRRYGAGCSFRCLWR